jgi:hypothetical protein
MSGVSSSANEGKKKLDLNYKVLILVGIIILILFSVTISLFNMSKGNNITGRFLLGPNNMSMTVVNAKPFSPELIFPVEVYTFNKVRFAWKAASDYENQPMTYNIQISSTPTFSGIIINVIINKLTYEMPFDLDYKTYYFRVRASDGEDYGPFSKIASFAVKPPEYYPNVTNNTEPPQIYIQSTAQISLIDSDLDGIPDEMDSCQNTIKSSIVDSSGCACYQKNCDDQNLCTIDYCTPENAICRHSFDNEKSCGIFTECPKDICRGSNYYNYETNFGKCMNGMCFENSCIPEVTYDSDVCGGSGEKEEYIKEPSIVEEGYYTYSKEEESFDDDNDGVPNYRDKCLNSISKFVDKYGCTCEQKRCIDLDPKTQDICYRGRCVFAPLNSEEYNKTLQLINLDKERKTPFNFNLLLFFLAVLVLFIIVFLIPSRKKEEENKDKNKKT